MKKQHILSMVSAFIMIVSVNTFASDTYSVNAIEEASKAGSHTSTSAGHSIAASGQVTSAASAVPLAVSGSAGAVSTEIAKELMDAATVPIGTPLEMTEESVTAGPPPDQALAPKKTKQNN